MFRLNSCAFPLLWLTLIVEAGLLTILINLLMVSDVEIEGAREVPSHMSVMVFFEMNFENVCTVIDKYVG